MQTADATLNQTAGETARPAFPAWLALLGGATLLAAMSQVCLPFGGRGRVGFADVALAAAFAGLLWDQFRHGRRYGYPAILAAALGLYVLSGLLGRGGKDAAIESVQRFQQLFCGFLVFAMVWRERRQWILPILTVGVGANLLIAFVQARIHGYGSTLPPADVLALGWGVGGAYTGLFRGRVALGLFLGAALAFAQPGWLAWAGDCVRRRGLVLVGTALGLSAIAYGPLLVIAGTVLIAMGLLQGRRQAVQALAAVALAVILIAGMGSGSVLRESLSPFKEGSGEVKTWVMDTVAAMRMATRRPWTGVGAGSYQRYVGRCYGELPKPNYNDIETDTQSGLGILFGTVGFPAGMVLLLAVFCGWMLAVKRSAVPDGSPAWQAGAAGALAVLLGALLFTDPFARGPVWLLVLALTVAFDGGGMVLDWRRTLACGIVFAALAAVVFTVPGKDALARLPSASGSSVRRPAPAAPRPSAPGSAGAVAALPSGGTDLFRVIDASEAKTVTAPFKAGTDSLAAKGRILEIAEGAGTPPEGEDSDMKHGGAAFTFDLPAPTRCKIWVRVWWSGSCGNTISLRVNDEERPVVIGNDGTYTVWHWLESPKTYDLGQGTHTLYILNREDGIRFDQLLITNDMEYFPQGIEEE